MIRTTTIQHALSNAQHDQNTSAASLTTQSTSPTSSLSTLTTPSTLPTLPQELFAQITQWLPYYHRRPLMLVNRNCHQQLKQQLLEEEFDFLAQPTHYFYEYNLPLIKAYRAIKDHSPISYYQQTNALIDQMNQQMVSKWVQRHHTFAPKEHGQWLTRIKSSYCPDCFEHIERIELPSCPIRIPRQVELISMPRLRGVVLKEWSVHQVKIINCPELNFLHAGYCRMTQCLLVGEFPALEDLNLRFNTLTHFHGHHRQLKSLDLTSNPIKALDISDCGNLDKFSPPFSYNVKPTLLSRPKLMGTSEQLQDDYHHQLTLTKRFLTASHERHKKYHRLK